MHLSLIISIDFLLNRGIKMFNTDDKLIQGCMFLAGLIFFAYGAVMMFNTDFMMERYPTFENNQTTEKQKQIK